MDARKQILVRRTYAPKAMLLLLTPCILFGFLIGNSLILHDPVSIITVLLFLFFVSWFAYEFIPYHLQVSDNKGLKIGRDLIDLSMIESMIDGEIIAQPYIVITTRDTKIIRVYPATKLDRDSLTDFVSRQVGLFPHILRELPVALAHGDFLLDVMMYLLSRGGRFDSTPDLMRIWNREVPSATEANQAKLVEPYTSRMLPAWVGYVIIALGIGLIYYLYARGSQEYDLLVGHLNR